MASATSDVVVIGAGVSGLVAAGFLAQEGRSVIVLEQGPEPGGCVGGFSRKGFQFDGGAQSFENVGQLFPLLGDLGVLDELEPERVRYRLRTPTVDCSLSDGYEPIVDAFCTAHPESEAELRGLFGELVQTCQAIQRVTEFGRSPRAELGLAKLRSLARLAARSPGALARTLRSERESYRALVERWMGDSELARLLGTFMYRDSSLFGMAAMLHTWQRDYWRPRRGVQDLSGVLVRRVEALGGQVRMQASVDQVLRIGSRVIGVRLAGGEELRAPVVVAACDRVHLWRDLLGLPVQEPTPEDVSDAFFTTFLGLDLSESELDRLLPEDHTFLVPAHRDCRLDPLDLEGHRWRWIEVSRGSRSGSGAAKAPAGCSSLVVQSMTRADWANWWGLDPDRRRNGVYRKLKSQVEQELLDALEQFVPGLRSHIMLRFSATPWTYQWYTRNTHGASAGWSWDPRRARAWHAAHRELEPKGLRGLLQCGHWCGGDIVVGSVPGGALTGWQAAMAALRLT